MQLNQTRREGKKRRLPSNEDHQARLIVLTPRQPRPLITSRRACRLHLVIAPLVVLANSEDGIAIQALPRRYHRFLSARRRERRRSAVEISALGLLAARRGVVCRWVVAALLGIEGAAEGGNFEAFVVLRNLGYN